jgi:hypothetical protein
VIILAQKTVYITDENAQMLKALSGLTDTKMVTIANMILGRELRKRLKQKGLEL